MTTGEGKTKVRPWEQYRGTGDYLLLEPGWAGGKKRGRRWASAGLRSMATLIIAPTTGRWSGSARKSHFLPPKAPFQLR